MLYRLPLLHSAPRHRQYRRILFPPTPLSPSLPSMRRAPVSMKHKKMPATLSKSFSITDLLFPPQVVFGLLLTHSAFMTIMLHQASTEGPLDQGSNDSHFGQLQAGLKSWLWMLLSLPSSLQPPTASLENKSNQRLLTVLLSIYNGTTTIQDIHTRILLQVFVAPSSSLQRRPQQPWIDPRRRFGEVARQALLATLREDANGVCTEQNHMLICPHTQTQSCSYLHADR